MTPNEHSRLLEETWIVQVEHHAMLPSTSDRGAELAKTADITMPLLVIADMQTAGRGRGGNRWWTGEGSLTFSVLFDAVLSGKNPDFINPSMGEGVGVRADSSFAIPLISLAVGLAVLETVRPLVGNHEIGLHWPNDVFVAGRKLAGILVEVLADRKTIVGIGLNVNNSSVNAPPELQSVATTLYDLTETRHDRIAILISLLNQLKRYLDLARSSPERLVEAADAVCLQKNQVLHLQWGSTEHVGCCRGIGTTGAILLETEKGLQAFSSGILLKK